LNKKIYLQLSAMMFIEFFIWGAWYVTVGNYMARVGMTDAIYWAYTVGPIGAIISPFFLGMIADRFFATEKVLGVLHLIGGVAIFLTPFFAEGEFVSAPLFIIFLLIHMLCYMPTVGLVNTLAFHHITDQEKYFPVIRVFGTIGWIVAGVFVSGVLGADETAIPLQAAAIASIVMGLYSFSLPHTPPPAAGEKISARQIMGLDALAQLKSRPFIVFIISSFLICIPLAVYYAYAPVFVNTLNISNPAFKMSFGQMSEAVFIILMPFFFRILGVKWMLFVGMLAWVLRYALFSLAAPSGILWMVMGGILLHGICYDFFFVAGQIYVDKKSTAAIRGQAQGFLVLITYGIGMFIGAQISGWVFNAVINKTAVAIMEQWQYFWMLPAVLAGIILVFFTILFNDKAAARSQAQVSN
jgi:nucleoside transporter